MGHVKTEVKIGDLKGDKIIQVEALVDTGSTFTVIPEDIARELNLPVTGERVKVLTARGYDDLELTHALIEINGKRRIVPILVSASIDRVLVGVITLEAMQLRVNPLTEKLEEYTALLYIQLQ